jgi:hypothetical protein
MHAARLVMQEAVLRTVIPLPTIRIPEAQAAATSAPAEAVDGDGFQRVPPEVREVQVIAHYHLILLIIVLRL